MSPLRGGNHHSSLRHILRDRASKQLAISPQHDSSSNDLPMSNVVLDNALEVIRSVTFDDNPNQFHDDEVNPGVVFEQGGENNEDSAADSSSSSYWALMEYGLGDSGPKTMDWNNDLSEEALQQLLGASLVTTPDQEEIEAVLNDETDPNVSWSDDENDRSAMKSLFTVPIQKTSNADDDSPRSISPTDDDSNPNLAKFPPNGSPFTTFRRNSTSIALEETQHYLRKIHSLEKQLQEAQQQVTKLQHLQKFPTEKDPRATIFRTPATNARFSTGIRRTRSFSELSKPQTPGSVMYHNESLWERNKTLVTEIRFADQTCMELACQNTALTKERDDWQKKYEATKERNVFLQELVETTQCSLVQAEATIESLRQVYSNSCDEHTEIMELKSQVKLSSQQVLDALEVNQKLRREIVDMTTQMETEKEKTTETVRRVFHFMNEQMERLHLAAYAKCSKYEAKLAAFGSAVKLLEDAILEFDDDDEASCTIPTLSSKAEETSESNIVYEDAVTVKSGCVNATFSDHRKRNQSFDLARMEEARASLPMDCVHGKSESPMVSPDKSNTTAKSEFLLSYLAGLSDIEVSLLSEGTSEPRGGSSNSKFLQHLQWMSSTPNPIQAIGVYGKHPAAQTDSPGDSSQSTNEPLVSNFHRSFKNLSRHYSNLTYSISEHSSISKASPSMGAVGRIMNGNLPHASIGNEETFENVSVVHLVEQVQSLQHAKEAMMEILDESMCQLSKLQDLASSQEHFIGIRAETLQMEKRAIENELQVVTRESEHDHEASDEVTSVATIGSIGIDVDGARDALRIGRNKLARKLDEKIIEINDAQDQIRYLQAEAEKRESLRTHYEALCLEKAEADALLQEKLIFPRALVDQSEALIKMLHEEIASFREELASSTRKIELLTTTVEELQSEKAEKLHGLESSFQGKVDECEALRQNIESLREDLDALKVEKEKLQEDIALQSDAINTREEVVANLQQRLRESNDKMFELQTTVQDLNDRYLTARNELKELQDDRDLIREQVESLSDTCKQLEGEKVALLSQLSEKDGMIDEANRLQLQMDVQAGELAHCFETIQTLENDVLRSNKIRERSAEEIANVRQSNEYLESKCTRLKAYIRKLSQKCEEWEKYHDRESNVLQHLKQGYQWNRQKAAELSVICQEKDQKVIDLMQAQRDLEDEMEDIARELEPICENLGNASLYVQ